MRYLLFFCFLELFFTKTAFAQEQITDFENDEVVFPTNLSFVDTLDNDIYFTAQTKIFDKPVLWISDGTTAGTRPIKDAKGNFIYSINTKTVFNNKLYVYAPEQQQLYSLTDSTTTEIPLTDPASPVVHLQAFDDSLVVMQTRDYKYFVGMLDTSNHYTLLHTNVRYYLAEKDVLFWVKDDTQKAQDLLYRADNQSVLLYYTFGNNNYFDSYSFRHQTLFGIDYFFFGSDGNGQILSIDPQNANHASLRYWGSGYGHYNLKNVIFDKNNTPYFHKLNNGILELYQVFPNDSLHLEKSVNYYEIAKKQYDYTGIGEYLFHIEKENDEWYFITSLCGEGCYGIYLTVYSSKKDEYKRSDRGNIGIWGKNLIVSKIDSNSYNININVRPNENLNYNFQTQKWTLDSTFQTTTSIPNDYSFFFNNKQFLFSDNLYLLSQNQKIALIEKYKIFDSNPTHTFGQMVLKDKFIFWTTKWNYNYQSHQVDVYSSLGDKKSTQLLFSFESNTYEIEPIEFAGKLYFFNTTPNLGFKIYETDGTKESTKILYKIDEVMSTYSYQVSHKKSKNILFFGLYAGGKDFMYIKNNTLFSIATRQFDTDPEFYLTDDVLFLKGYIEGKGSSLYTIENGELKSLASNVGDVATYKNTLYFATQTGIFYTTDGKKINGWVKKSANDFRIVGNWLITNGEYHSLKYDKIYKDLPILTIGSIVYSGVFSFNDELIILNSGDYRSNIRIISEHNFINKTFDNYIAAIYANSIGYWLIMQNSSIIFWDKTGDIHNVGNNEIGYWNNPRSNTYMFILQDISNRNYYKWNYKEKQIEKIVETTSSNTTYLPIDNANGLINTNYSLNNNYIYLHFNGNEIVQKYRLDNFRYNDYQNNGFFGTAFRPNKGYELAQIGADSLVFFPEIVKGDEGIILGKAFMFKNSAYAYCYTPTHGWQVWKMEPLPTVSAADSTVKISPELLVSEILANEPTASPNITVYPNPSSSFVSITSDKALNYRLVDERGKLLIENSTTTERNVSITNLPTGIYILQVYSDTFSKSYKIIKKE